MKQQNKLGMTELNYYDGYKEMFKIQRRDELSGDEEESKDDQSEEEEEIK